MKDIKTKGDKKTSPDFENPPAWEKCPDCDSYWCNIHNMHAYDCDCPPIDDWDKDPYS